MRTVTRNKRKMKYALNIGTEEILKRDSQGNIVYTTINGVETPVKTGERRPKYSTPVEFYAPLSMSSGGDVEVQEFGVSMSDYHATMLYLNGSLPITETSLIWYESEPTFYEGANGQTYPDGKSADFTVVKISESINYKKAILKRVTK